jgi:(p)ppGpp synthase/HD superfamily hydrolase
VLDFAFSVHTDLGYQCVAGKIDGKAYPINTVLKSGVTIEIIKAKFQHPNPSWLNWVKTSKAKRDIRYWLKQKSYQHTTALGKELFEREEGKRLELTYARALVSMKEPSYDRAIRAVGVRFVEVTTAAELEAAYSDRTAMVFLYGDASERGQITVKEMAAAV